LLLRLHAIVHALRYSVDTIPDFCSNAARSVCHTRVAHFTRVGNPRNPENTASLPKPAGSPSPVPIAASRNLEKSCSISAFDLPLMLSVISDADAFEIAQPSPSKPTSRTTSLSRSRYTLTLSPQSGLKPSAWCVAFSSRRKFLGRRL